MVLRKMTRYGSMLVAAYGVIAAGHAHAATAHRETAGKTADGKPIEAVLLKGDNGVTARILTYGATLQSLTAPDRNGTLADVVLGFDKAEDYEARPSYYGVTVGRFANRIAGARFSLDGTAYHLASNNGANSLHGGTQGFDKKLWRIIDVKQGANASVTMALTSPDGDEGYPGTLDVRVTYALDDWGSLTIDFHASTNKSTIVNLTNHAIFNLAGENSPRDVLGHKLTIPASRYTPVSEALIPTGKLWPVAGTVFDFTSPRLLGDGVRDGRDTQIAYGRGYDHNFVLDKGITATPELVARLEDPESGRVLDVLSTEPGLQVYTGNFLDGLSPGKNQRLYRQGDGIALEPQKFPDSPNQPNFPSARVDPGKPYRHVMIYRVSVAR